MRGRFDHYVGFVAPPASFDCSPQHFLSVAPDGVGVAQHICHAEGFVYGPDVPSESLTAMSTGVAALAASQIDVIAQVGAYWALPFTPDEPTARDLAAELAGRHNVKIVMVWLALIDALRHMGARRLVVTTGYYRPAWTAAAVALLEKCGFDIVWAGDIVDQGIVADQGAKEAIEAATRWDYPDDIVRRACVDAGRRAPDADAVVQTGSGMRPSVQAAAIEAEIGRPLISTDLALYWAILTAADIAARSGCGRLLETTRG